MTCPLQADECWKPHCILALLRLPLTPLVRCGLADNRKISPCLLLCLIPRIELRATNKDNRVGRQLRRTEMMRII